MFRDSSIPDLYITSRNRAENGVRHGRTWYQSRSGDISIETGNLFLWRPKVPQINEGVFGARDKEVRISSHPSYICDFLLVSFRREDKLLVEFGKIVNEQRFPVLIENQERFLWSSYGGQNRCWSRLTRTKLGKLQRSGRINGNQECLLKRILQINNHNTWFSTTWEVNWSRRYAAMAASAPWGLRERFRGV